MTLPMTDYAHRDRDGAVAFYVALWKRRELPLALFDDYWRDVHGPICARLPGQYQYWQFHVAHSEGPLWLAPAGVELACPDEDQIDGIAELTFPSEAHRRRWFEAADILMKDEPNLFAKAIGYTTQPGRSCTYVDRFPDGAPNGPIATLRLHVLVRKRATCDGSDFHHYMTERFAPSVASSPRVSKLRMHLLDAVDISRKDADGVIHTEPPRKQYQAAFEIAFPDRLAMRRFFASPEYACATQDQTRFVQQLLVFPERAAYTFVHEGRMTLAGQRGSSVADLIVRLGAENQLHDEITALLGQGAASRMTGGR